MPTEPIFYTDKEKLAALGLSKSMAAAFHLAEVTPEIAYLACCLCMKNIQISSNGETMEKQQEAFDQFVTAEIPKLKVNPLVDPSVEESLTAILETIGAKIWRH